MPTELSRAHERARCLPHFRRAGTSSRAARRSRRRGSSRRPGWARRSSPFAMRMGESASLSRSVRTSGRQPRAGCGRTRLRGAARLSLPRLPVRCQRAVRRHALRGPAPIGKAAGLRDPRDRRHDLRLVGHRGAGAPVGPARGHVRPGRLERPAHPESALPRPSPGDDGELGGHRPPALRPRLRQRGPHPPGRGGRPPAREPLGLQERAEDRRAVQAHARLLGSHPRLRARILPRGGSGALDPHGYAPVDTGDARRWDAHRPLHATASETGGGAEAAGSRGRHSSRTGCAARSSTGSWPPSSGSMCSRT